MFKTLLKVVIGLVCVGLLLPMLLTAQESGENAPVELRVMTFNIWVGGELVDFGKIVEAIQLADADIVGLQEPTGNTQRLAQALGWQYASDQMHVISRYPLIDPPGANGDYIYVQIAPGQVVAIANVHLTSDPYGPYEIRDGVSEEAVFELEQGLRLAEIEPLLARLSGLIDAGVPVFLTGDFNTPSHQDWTSAVAETRPDVLYPVAWPVTMAVEAAGFVDTFRAVYPDPIENPGITWTYGYPYPRLSDGEIIDRIDMVFAANTVEVLSSEIVGDAGTPNVDIGLTPYGSDHRAVVSTVRVVPAVPPAFVAVHAPSVKQGEQLVVRYHAPGGEETDRIVIVPVEGDPVADALMWLPPYEASFFGSVTFGTGTLAAGQYAAVLVTVDDAELSRSPFWVLEPDAVPSVVTERDTYAPGDPITVTWANTHAMRRDWVAIYSADSADLYNDYWAYAYTGALVNGEFTFDAALLGDEMLPAGDYEVRLLTDDGYGLVAVAGFTIE
ncbi:MAG: endonuclease/exonuclease/phosphatase family protein [Armatimonadetes bacterium]|nr:endonuclease/exonuclease/phosphatase family protein [Anaerolineae bacterium]